jgi:Fe2+ or Zn2+ uptake regulation protein
MRSADQLMTAMRAQGLRVTPQRMRIVAQLVENATHPTVEALYEATRVEMPSISLKTVYQTVHDLEAMGEVTVLEVGTGSVRVDPNVEDAHQHLICTECGKVRDVLVDVGSLELSSREGRGFTVADVEVNFRGVCDDCAGTKRS